MTKNKNKKSLEAAKQEAFKLSDGICYCKTPDHPQIAKSVFVLETDKTLREVFAAEEKIPVSFGEYMVEAVENSDKISSPKKFTLGRIYMENPGQ